MEKNPESVNTTLETFGSPTPFLDPQGLFIFCYLVCSSDFFWRFCPKIGYGWINDLETFHEENSGVLKKKTQKMKIVGDNPSL